MSARHVLALVAIASLASCGGGGGGESGTTLSGRLHLEQSSSPASLGASSLPRAAATHVDREPNDHLFSAVDLGRGVHPARVDGEVHRDPDVFRVGPCAPGSVQVECSGDARASSAWSGRELTIVIRGDGRYRLETTPVPADVKDLALQAQLPPDVLGAGVECAAGEVLVCVDGGVTDALVRRFGLQLVQRAGGVERWCSPRVALVAEVAGRALALADLIRELRRALPQASYVAPNTICRRDSLAGDVSPNDPLFSRQFNLHLTGFPQAWDITKGEDDVAIAVMDTGILADHPDFVGRLSPLGYDFIGDPGEAGDGDSYDADPSEPRKFETMTVFHGTYVAGVVGAVANNGEGVAGGVWRGKVIPIRVFGFHHSTSFDRIQAYRYLGGRDNVSKRVLGPSERPRVVNLSFIVPPTTGEKAEIEHLFGQGIVLVAAVGNEGKVPSPPVYPAAWPEVIGVGSVARNLARAPYSNGGSFLDVVAPGGVGAFTAEGVISTWGLTFENKFVHSYQSFQGTSVATPAVGAAVALMEAVHPNMHPVTARRILRSSAFDLGVLGPDLAFGAGLLQADAAVKAAILQNIPPLMSLEPTVYTLRSDETEASLSVRNTGGRLLTGLEVTAVSPVSGAISLKFDDKWAPTWLRVTVDRSKARVGTHLETFRLTSNGGQSLFDIGFTRPIPAAFGTLVIRVLDGERVLGQATVGATDGSFALPDLPTGSWVFEAGVDVNNNGRIGDAQEWYLRRTITLTGPPTVGLGDVVVPWKQ
ncbi:MAG: hypothetical protein CMJ85_02420 [Planctomycetes bacterium]|nr:hypothetical protein [Planctomycetota bacterium]